MSLMFCRKKRLTNKDIVQSVNQNQKLSTKVQMKICNSLNSIADALKDNRRKKTKPKRNTTNNKVEESDSDSESVSDFEI